MTKTGDIGNDLVKNLSIANKQQTDKARNELGQDEFFKLMTAQLQNQDPLKPLESNEFLAQMAQFSMVSGVQEMQQTFSSLSNALQSSQALQASTLVGRSVLIPGSRGTLDAQQGLQGAVELPQASPQVTLSIVDDLGQTVRRIDLGAQSAGLVDFTWDGLTDGGEQAPPGSYTVRGAYDAGDDALAAETLVVAHVDSVTLGRGGQAPELNLSGQDSVSLGVVRRIL
ncbi:MAG: flagellar hook assembly protein FlgD [Gammaproteobacteria bacterium]|nr:flagellar hook assembly protein FlgD [Gammaproteobacteria bacterium]